MQREEVPTTGEAAGALGAPLHGSHARVHLSLPGTPDSLPQIREAVVGCATRMGFGDEEIAKIEMAVGEACSNVIEHAYMTQPLRLEIDVTIACFLDRIEVTIVDYSTINFPVDEEEGVPLDEYLGAFRRRGLGLYIIRNFVDSVDHRFIGGRGNELRLVKFLA
jgi:serine/threonine-protein kinase RsbW